MSLLENSRPGRSATSELVGCKYKSASVGVCVFVCVCICVCVCFLAPMRRKDMSSCANHDKKKIVPEQPTCDPPDVEVLGSVGFIYTA